MQEKTSQNEIFFIIERLKSYFQVDSDSKLAQILGVKPNTISTWKARHSVDWPLIFSKCDNLNLNWLLTGEGPMLRNTDGFNDGPAQVATVVEQSCAQCAIKDKLIESQQATIEAQRETINLLKQELKTCSNSKKPTLPDTLPTEATAKLKKD